VNECDLWVRHRCDGGLSPQSDSDEKNNNNKLEKERRKKLNCLTREERFKDQSGEEKRNTS
jgi:hypothetical protein